MRGTNDLMQHETLTVEGDGDPLGRSRSIEGGRGGIWWIVDQEGLGDLEVFHDPDRITFLE